MLARFPGNCAGGGDRVTPGESIVRDGRGWSHPRCRRFEAGRASRVYARIEATDGRRAADDWDAREARRERERDDAEYAAGIEDANRWRFNRDMFGEGYAAAEEYARDLRGLNGDW